MKKKIASFLFFYMLFMNIVARSQVDFCGTGFGGDVHYKPYVFTFEPKPCGSRSCGDLCLDQLSGDRTLGYTGCCGSFCICCIS
ncbi:hypothetical protein Hanom_Chr03g00184981 [Helianthus anomalus]